MANINKIRLSGQTYDIQDPNASKTVELTQAQYDALAVKDPNTFYIITDATAGDLSNYYTKSETSGATQISTALASKQDTLVSGTNIKTINNESLLGSGNIDIQGGGSSYTAGRGISIENNEISFNLPISAGTGANSIVMGEKATANGAWSFANGNGNILNGTSAAGERAIAIGYVCEAKGNTSIANGQYCTADGIYSHAIGSYVNALNNYETSIGQYNVSNTGTTNAANTLFSVGNGTNSARHNAFEIRQNGDIYCSDGTNDVKLQDTITATAANTTALGGLKLVKLTQSEYDALTTKDDNTVYFIGDSTNGYTMKIGSANVN